VAGSDMSAGGTMDGHHAYTDAMAAPGSQPVDALPEGHPTDPTIEIAIDQPEPSAVTRPGPYRARPMTWTTL
jgi:hypothetical protein